LNHRVVSVEVLRRVIGALPRSIVVTDADGTVLIWNQMAEQLFGWTEDDVIGQPIDRVLVAAADDELPPRGARRHRPRRGVAARAHGPAA